jgi:small subunit ribosomal protein S17
MSTRSLLRKTRVGVVVSDKMNKSVIVEVVRTVQHPFYKKYVRKRARFMAHDEKNGCQLGDKVRIVETRPLSRNKCWRVQEKLG